MPHERVIVYVNNFPGARMGGGEVYTMHVARGAAAAGMRVHMVAEPGSGLATAAREAGMTVHEEPLNASRANGAASRVLRIARDARADVLHGTGYYTNLVTRLAGRRASAAVVNTVQCEPASTLSFSRGPLARLSQAARALADNASARRADAVIAICGNVAAALRRQGLNAARLETIHNAVDAPLVRGTARAHREEARRLLVEAFGAEEGPLVGTVGRLEPVKGLDVLFDAVPGIVRRCPDVRFAIVGEGPEGERLAARVAAEEALAGRVRMLGALPWERTVGLTSMLDVYCLPSLSEGLNTTLLEAGALGIPVVSTRVGGTPEAVADGETGLLVEAGDAAALASAVASLIEDHDRASGMGTAGRALVEREFSVERMVERTLAVYADVLGGR